MNINNIVFPICAILLSACAAKPPPRPEISNIPPPNTEYGRLYISSGWMGGFRLSYANHVGPVYINGKMVGKTAKDEYFVVDITPGKYELSCEPSEPEKNRVDKNSFTFNPGDMKYLVCSMGRTDISNFAILGGAIGGAILAASSDYLTRSFIEEVPFDEKRSRLVGYTVFKD